MKYDIINSKMMRFFTDRRQSLGVINGGLENYYNRRIENGSILNDRDIYILGEIETRYRPGITIHEMASGAAQLGHTLDFLGYFASASELGKKRFLLAVELGKYLGSTCHIINEDSFLIEIPARLFVTVNAISSMVNIKKSIDFIIEKTSGGSDFILNAEVFGTEESNIKQAFIDSGINYTELEKGFLLIASKDQ